MSALDWTATLLEELTYHGDDKARPRLEGLTDGEYLWEPVAGAWSVRPRAEATSPMAAGPGDVVIDFAFPEPSPVPGTTIAGRLALVVVGVSGSRDAAHFGGPPIDDVTFPCALDAATAPSCPRRREAHHRADRHRRGAGDVPGGRGLGPGLDPRAPAVEYMANRLQWAGALRGGADVRDGFMTRRDAMVHEGDVGGVIAAASGG